MAPSPYWGDGEDLGQRRPRRTTRCSTRRAGSGSRRAFARRPNPAFCKKGSDHPSAKVFPLQSSGRQVTMYDPKTEKFTHVDTCFPTHHVQFGYDANNTLWVERGRAGERRGRLGQHEDAGRDRRRAEVAGLDAVHSRHQRQRQARRIHRAEPAGRSQQGRRANVGVLRRRRRAATASMWGTSLGFPGYVVHLDPTRAAIRRRRRSRKSTKSAGARLWPARHRHRHATTSCGCRSRAATWPSFDRRKCKVPQRTDDPRRPALPGGLDALSVPRPEVRRRSRHRLRGSELLHLGRPVRHARARQGRAVRHRQRERVAHRAQGRQDGQPASCPIRWASTPRASTAASTIPTPAGRAAACGRPTGNRTPFHDRRIGKGNLPKVVKFQVRPDPLSK